ncbi:MAG TPA: fused MFS/spermidine synthase [Chitinivibrionales bacterium]|nr:fused MFS/spermidine synthase [Chitinivibrionales bacterium]
MKRKVVAVQAGSPHAVFILLIAALAGFCTMAYEVVWFRILKFFVDNSIHSFGIMLSTFLFGITVGGYLFPRFVDRKKDPLLFLGIMEFGIGLLCILSIPIISQLNNLMPALGKIFGENWNAEIIIRFVSFACAMLLPTMLMGGAFPVIGKIYSGGRPLVGKSIGEAYGVNTVGGVLGSFAGGFVLIPLFGVQNSVTVLSFLNILTGAACLLRGASLLKPLRLAVSGSCIVLACLLTIAIPQNAFLPVYGAKYPPPANTLLYLKENVNGTTAVFQDTRRPAQKYLLIDNTGEVSTDYFSMRAFRFLALLPALYCPQAQDALIVTFGSGIVAGAIAGLPGISHVDCVEICKEAFNAAKNFSAENHDVLNSPKINFIVNDGRNYVLTTGRRYDIISADATHPTSSDSWILYTKEFYALCKNRLNDRGIMCQWIPLHGILEKDYKIILNTFHTVFPYVAVYYSGGYKTFGHTVLLGSRSPMTIDFFKAQELFQNTQIKDDLVRLNINTIYDFFNGFLMDQDAIAQLAGSAPVNTDDKPRIIFSKFELEKKPFMELASIIKNRKSVYPQLSNLNPDSALAVKQRMERNFEAMGHVFDGLMLEYKEATLRIKQDFGKSKAQIIRNLMESKAIFEQMISNYQTALQLDPEDYNAKFLLMRVSSELDYLNSFLDAMQANGGNVTDGQNQ